MVRILQYFSDKEKVMGCCDGKIRTVRRIAPGYTGLARSFSFSFSDARIWACQQCSKCLWSGPVLCCTKGKFDIIEEAHKPESKCELGKWPPLET